MLVTFPNEINAIVNRIYITRHKRKDKKQFCVWLKKVILTDTIVIIFCKYKNALLSFDILFFCKKTNFHLRQGFYFSIILFGCSLTPFFQSTKEETSCTYCSVVLCYQGNLHIVTLGGQIDNVDSKLLWWFHNFCFLIPRIKKLICKLRNNIYYCDIFLHKE